MLDEPLLERHRVLRPQLRAFLTLVEGLIGKWQTLTGHPGFRKTPFATLYRLLIWRLRCWLSLPATVTLQKWGSRLHVPALWLGAGKMIFVFRESCETELKHLDHFVSPGMTFLDIGANYGIYTVAAASLVGSSGRVFSFEPCLDTFAILSKNVESNGLRNVRLFGLALSNRDGEARLYHHERGADKFFLGTTTGNNLEFEEVMTRTLDSVFCDEMAGIDFIKIDVEGAEELVLRGAEKIINENHPTIILEINYEAARRLALDPHGALSLLGHWGYQFFALSEAGELRAMPYPSLGGNVIAVHGKPDR